MRLACFFASFNKNIFKKPKCPLSLVIILDIFLCCNNVANPPPGEHSLHHNNNLLDANLAKKESEKNELKKKFRAETFQQK